jgi:hypothetical protein
LQRSQESADLNSMFATSILDRMKARDWTANTVHLEIEKNPYGAGMPAHHVIDQ